MQCCISNSKQDASHVQKDEVVRAEDRTETFSSEMTNKRLISKGFNWVYFYECSQHRQLIAWWWWGLALSLTLYFCKKHVWHWELARISPSLKMKENFVHEEMIMWPLFTSMCWARLSLFAGQMHLFPSLPYISHIVSLTHPLFFVE